MSLLKQAKELNPEVLSMQESAELLGNISQSQLYNYLKKANMETRKLADNTPYLLKEDIQKILFRGDGEVSKDEI